MSALEIVKSILNTDMKFIGRKKQNLPAGRSQTTDESKLRVPTVLHCAIEDAPNAGEVTRSASSMSANVETVACSRFASSTGYCDCLRHWDHKTTIVSVSKRVKRTSKPAEPQQTGECFHLWLFFEIDTKFSTTSYPALNFSWFPPKVSSQTEVVVVHASKTKIFKFERCV